MLTRTRSTQRNHGWGFGGVPPSGVWGLHPHRTRGTERPALSASTSLPSVDLGELTTTQIPGRSAGNPAPEAVLPYDTGSTARRPTEAGAGPSTRRRPGPGAHRRLPSRGDGVRTGRPVRHRTADGQQHPPPARCADAAARAVARTGRRRHPPVQPRLVPRASRRTPGRRSHHSADQTEGTRHPHPRHPRTTTIMNGAVVGTVHADHSWMNVSRMSRRGEQVHLRAGHDASDAVSGCRRPRGSAQLWSATHPEVSTPALPRQDRGVCAMWLV